MYSPFFCELNQLHEEAQESDEVRTRYAVVLIVQNVKDELRAYAKKGAAQASREIILSFKYLPAMYTFNPPARIDVEVKFPDLERARAQLAKEVPEITWAVIDRHSTPGVCDCGYCTSFGISATWAWTQCDDDLT